MKNKTEVHEVQYNIVKKNQNVFYECIPWIANLFWSSKYDSISLTYPT